MNLELQGELKLSAASCGESSILKRNKPSVYARLPRSKLRGMARWRIQDSEGEVMNPVRKWISIIGVFTVIIVVITGCSPKDVPMPAGVTATPGNGQVTIAWTAAPDATSYNIYWSTTPGVTPANGTKITGASSPYVQTGLINGTTYYYIVTSVNSHGESEPSLEVSATLALPGPTGVTATPGNGQVTIAWTAITDVTLYNIYWSTTPGVTPATGTKITGAVSPHVQTGLSNGTTYYYVVTAVGGAGESGPSSEVSAIPSAAPTPPAPADVVAIPGNSQVTIAWTAVTEATSYNIYRSTTPGVTPANGTKIADAANPFVQFGLVNNTAYYFIVTAVNANGESTPSSEVSATPSVNPFIRATVLSLTGGPNPFGWLQQVSVCTDSTCNAAITDALVTINDNILTYNSVKGQYEGNFTIAPGAVINLRVTLAVVGNIYLSTATQFAASVATIAPVLAPTWIHTSANTMSWTTSALNVGGTYIVGIINNAGTIVYPSPAALIRNGVFEVPRDATTFTVPANSLTPGSYQVFSGIAAPGISMNAAGTGIPIPGALPGSGVWVGRVLSFLPISVL
jgi:fibronectin type 3 domain-containing protein